eukprot:3628930-Heterocapsa_arctica.AAC.1
MRSVRRGRLTQLWLVDAPPRRVRLLLVFTLPFSVRVSVRSRSVASNPMLRTGGTLYLPVLLRPPFT